MSDRPVCARCSKPITGIIKIDNSKQKLGKTNLNKTSYYDEDCYLALNKERALNEFQKERINKKKNKR
jgi:hypothetical protein